MNRSSPRNADELAKQIEALVDAYCDHGRQAAEQAVQRAFDRQKAARRSRSRRQTGNMLPSRRGPEQIREVTQSILDCIRETPGATGTDIAERVGIPTKKITYPIRRLKRQGLVRVIGERQQARYFPTVAAQAG